MFTIDATITDLKVRERNLFKVLFSMNTHQVATPELSVEEARSYIFFFRDGGKVQIYVGLYFISTDRRMYYTHSSNPFPEAQMADVEDEARAFAEGLGAMLDEIDFGKLSTDDKNRWIEEQEFLSGKKEDPPVAVQPAVASSSSPTPQPPAEQPPAPIPQPAPLQQSPVIQTPIQTAPAAPPVQPAPVQPLVMQPVQTVPVPPPPAMLPPLQATPVPQAPIAQPAPPVPQAAPSMLTMPPLDVAPAQRSVRPRISPPQAAENGITAVRMPDDVLEQAVKEGVVKAPKAQLKKDIRSTTGTISRDKEALARLMASF